MSAIPNLYQPEAYQSDLSQPPLADPAWLDDPSVVAIVLPSYSVNQNKILRLQYYVFYCCPTSAQLLRRNFILLILVMDIA